MESKIKCRICRGHGFTFPKGSFICNKTECYRCKGTGLQDASIPKFNKKYHHPEYVKRDAGMEKLKKVKAI